MRVRSGAGWPAVRSEVLCPECGHRNRGGLARQVVALDEASVSRVFPDREARTGSSPGLECFGVRTAVRADPLEEVEDQVVDGV
jgi:hypothetical protein